MAGVAAKEVEAGGSEKAAMLLLALGPEAASNVLRHLGETEVRRVAQAIARVQSVSPEQLTAVRQDYEARLGGPTGLTVDGRSFAKTIVDKALADPSAPASSSRKDILAALEEQHLGEVANLASLLAEVPADGLAKLLENEHPQVATLILAHVRPMLASAVIQHLPEALQVEIIERLAHLSTAVPPALIAEIGRVISEQVKGLQRQAGRAAGGPKAVAEIMKHADKTLEARLLETLDERNPELAGAIRGLMFTFEDCIQLDNRSMQTLLKEVAREDLLMALKTASPALSEKIFANVSSRAAEILREDMASSGPARLRDVEQAQAKIVQTLRDLEAEGKVVVAGSGADDVLV